jgi:hypothetical protein
MRFTRTGTTYQLGLNSCEDLRDVLELDEALWVATSAPVSAFRCDPQFLSMVDVDGNGRINSDELRWAIEFLLQSVDNVEALAGGVAELSVRTLKAKGPKGEALVESAKYILSHTDEARRGRVSIEIVRGFIARVSSQPLNGDGIVIPEATDDAEVREFIRDAVACTGGTQDAAGKQGITAAQLEAFVNAARDFLEWKRRTQASEKNSVADILPLGPDTPSAWHLLHKHADKVDAFFDRMQFLSFRNAGEELEGTWPLPELQGIDLNRRNDMEDALKRAPLARVVADGGLPLDPEHLNPFYREWIQSLKTQVLRPILGEVPKNLSPQDWERVREVLAPYGRYLRGKKGAEVEALAAEKLRAYVEGPYEEQVGELLQQDRNVEAIVAGAGQILRILLYQQNLLRLARNFVSFPELFATDETALFEQGRTVMDGRWFNFALAVDDPANHATQTPPSNICTAYLELAGGEGDAKRHVAVPVTRGTKGNMRAGKRGVFFDPEGHELDARVINIVENPISLREALIAPFVGAWQFVSGRVQSLLATGRQRLTAGTDQAMTPAAPGQKGVQGAGGSGAVSGPVALVAGISVSIAALGSAFAFAVSSLAKAGPRPIGFALLALVGIIFVPLLVRVIWRLRRQDLSVMLEASGWAINHRIRLNRRLRRHFTVNEGYPRRASGGPMSRWLRVTIILLVMAGLVVGGYLISKHLWSRLPKDGPLPAEKPREVPEPDPAP